MKITLKRQNHREPNLEELNNMRHELDELICSDLDASDFDWKTLVNTLCDFQSEDGSFNLLDSYSIESDCRVDYCHEPTYICTALLMKAYLKKADLLCGKENQILPIAMKMCCARGLDGNGYDSLEGLVKAVKYFIKCDVVKFLEKYPDMCPEFTDMFTAIKEEFSNRVENKDFHGGWGINYEESIREINESLNKTYIFVYGTLMKGQHNHKAFLRDDSFVGKGTIEGYDMYNLGCYPGIVKGTGTVYGEVYSVTEAELKKIDRLEGEGSLYNRTNTIVEMNNETKAQAFVYEYIRDIEGYEKISGRYGNTMVWYVSYGSNLLEERLKYYIQGGYYEANGKTYTACQNTDMPEKSKQVMIPYNMFYSNYDMGSWKNSAVCFLDETKPGKAYGRAYLVTEEQLNHIHMQEGKSQNWYPDRIEMEAIDGIPAYTFGGGNAKIHEPFYRVSAEYGMVLYRGLHEAYPELSDNEIINYLRECGK